MKLESILGDPIPLLDKVFAALKKDRVEVSKFELDHVCYRVESFERYQELKKQLQKIGSQLSEAQINGRPIATFKLLEPILYQDRTIDCLELPAPKEGLMVKEGFEHVEFVIDSSFEEFIRQHPKVKFSVPEKPKKVNPEIAIKYQDFQVKFHHYRLEYVVKHLQ